MLTCRFDVGLAVWDKEFPDVYAVKADCYGDVEFFTNRLFEADVVAVSQTVHISFDLINQLSKLCPLTQTRYCLDNIHRTLNTTTTYL